MSIVLTILTRNVEKVNRTEAITPMSKRTRAFRLAVLLLAVAGMAAGTVGATANDTKLALVAYSTPREAYAKLLPAFQATPAGENVSFSQSYAGSGDQSRAILAGLPADVVEFSNEPDMTALVTAGIVSKGWNRGPYHGFATDSVVVFAVRNGNPKHIKSWADLVRPGVQVITPNPFSSGSAKWNILAAYGAERRLGKTDAQATNYVKQLFQHVVAQDTSGSNATNTFLSGKGDVLLTYESEALNARLQGKDIQYVIPRQTMLIELPIAAIKSSSNLDTVNKFIRFVKSQPAQELFAQYGFRPVNKTVAAEASVK